jgi:hypothetical protein
MNQLTQTFLSIPDRDLPARQAGEYISFSQHELFFHLAIAKNAKLMQLRKHYKRQMPCKVMLGPRFAGFECCVDGYEISVLERDFFRLTGGEQDEEKKRRLSDSIVIVNNNDIASQDARVAYSKFTQECITTCFVAWDWDNHHWLELSTFLAAYSDFYAPSHHENLYLLSRYNWLLIGPVYCATEQWPKKFLTDNLDRMLQAERSSLPLGMHIPHPRFDFRMQVVNTLNKFYPSIGFSNPDFHHRSREDRFNEWCAYKTHWIAPVLNDVPIRLFDALITGGIPIVPESMRYLPPIAQIPRQFIAFYSAADIVNPEPLVAYANELFDLSGKSGIVERHRYALENHHSDISIAHILKVVHEQFSA